MKLEHWLVVIFALGTILVLHLLRRHARNKFGKVLASRDIEQIENFCDTTLAKYSIPPFNMEYGKMSVYLLNGDEKKAFETFERLLTMRKNKNQELDITLKAFRYYVSKKNQAKAKEMYEKICEIGNETQVHESTIMYDVYMLDRSNHIDEIITRYEECAEGSEMIYAEMLALMYKNRGDKDKAKYYSNVATGKTKREKKKVALSETENLNDELEEEKE